MRRTPHAFFAVPLLVLGALSARAEDVVYLRDGRVIRGKVNDAGSTIEIQQKHGATIVERKDVLRIEIDEKAAASQPASQPADELDTVYLYDGRVLRGKVRISDDSKEVIVATKDSEIRHPIEGNVKAIRFHGSSVDVSPVDKKPVEPDAGTKSLRDAIDRQLAILRDASKDEKERAKARAELLELAPFAAQYLEAIADREKQDPLLQEIVRDVERVRALKSVVHARIEAGVPRLYEKLISADEATRISALREAVLGFPEEVAPLLVHVLKREDESAAVRTHCVGELTLLKKFDDLAAVLRARDGQLRLAAAVALGDNGIYAGVPILMDALRLQKPSIREWANDKLKAWTGKDFGFLPNDREDRRDAAIKRWEEWWAVDGPKIVERSSRWSESQVPDEDKQSALKFWHDANSRLDELAASERGETKKPLGPKERAEEYERVAWYLKKALDLDPTLTAARLSRAIVCYENLSRPLEAEKDLLLVLNRFAAQEAVLPRKLAHYHLGRIYQLDGRTNEALKRFEDAIRLDQDWLEPRVALGDAFFQAAMDLAAQPPQPTASAPAGGAGGGHDDGKPEGPRIGPGVHQPDQAGKSAREQALEGAIIAYRQALEVVARRLEALLNSTKDFTTAAGEGTQTFQEGRLLTAIKEDRRSVDRRGAEVHWKLGRAYAARQRPEYDKLAREEFSRAKELAPDVKRYVETAAAWERVPGGEPPAKAPQETPRPAEPGKEPPEGKSP